MKIRLRTNFSDYYDRAFSNTGELVFNRFDRTDIGRRQMFGLLSTMGFWVPAYGPAGFMSSNGLDRVVVHDDEFAHCGEGKRLIDAREMCNEKPTALCVAYIPAQSCSIRYLVVGGRSFWVRYRSRDDWRSNCGEVVVSAEESERPAERRGCAWPMFAVDFVEDSAGRRWAIDLNSAPGLSPIQQFMSPEEVVEAITPWVHQGQHQR